MLHSVPSTTIYDPVTAGPALCNDNVLYNKSLELLAKKCIHDHRHPIVKVSLPARKLFFTAKNDEERALIKEHQDQFLTILDHQRVEKKSSRAQAIWLADKCVAKVTRIVKNLVKYFGIQNKDGVFLYPEEMLYLLETNRLEVTSVDSSLSIEEAYELVLHTDGVNLTKYRAYKKLATLGYKLIRFEQLQSKTTHRVKKIEMKRTFEGLDSSDLPEVKKCKQSEFGEIKENLEENVSGTDKDSDMSTNKHLAEISFPKEGETSIPKEAEYILNVFDQLRQNMPKDFSKEIQDTYPDYCVWSPTNTLKVEPDYNLFICENNIVDKKIFNNIPNIYAICIDDVSFYGFSEVHLPYIEPLFSMYS